MGMQDFYSCFRNLSLSSNFFELFSKRTTLDIQLTCLMLKYVTIDLWKL